MLSQSEFCVLYFRKDSIKQEARYRKLSKEVKRKLTWVKIR